MVVPQGYQGRKFIPTDAPHCLGEFWLKTWALWLGGLEFKSGCYMYLISIRRIVTGPSLESPSDAS